MYILWEGNNGKGGGVWFCFYDWRVQILSEQGVTVAGAHTLTEHNYSAYKTGLSLRKHDEGS
jgi:hypothetical protein